MIHTTYKKSGEHYDLKICLLSWDLFLAQKRILTFDTMVNVFPFFTFLIIHQSLLFSNIYDITVDDYIIIVILQN